MASTLPTITTMQDILSTFTLSPNVDPARKVVIVNDVKQAFAENPSLANLEANGTTIMHVLKKFNNSKRRKNIRANIRALLKWYNGENPGARKRIMITGEWGELFNNTEITKREMYKLTRFGRYAFLKGREPDTVCDALVDDFMTEVRNIGTVEDLDQLRSYLVLTWNDCSAKIGCWPQVKLTPPTRRGPPIRSPSMALLGEPLAAEIRACMTYLGAPTSKRPEGPISFDEPADGGTSAVRPDLERETLQIYERYARRAVRIVSETSGRPYTVIRLREICEPAMAITIMNAVSRELFDAGKGKNALYSMATTLVTIAEHFIKVSSTDLARLKLLTQKIGRVPATLTAKNVGRLRALVLSKRQQLMRLPACLINPALQAHQSGRVTKKLLLDAEVGVAIAFELNVPIRVGSLTAIRVPTHLNIPERRGSEGWLDMPADLVKNDEPISRRIEVDLAELLRSYISKLLPYNRSNPTNTALFPGQKDDSTKGSGNFGMQVSAKIAKHLGIEMNVHLFRHFAAIAYLEDHPGEYEVVRVLLGNRSLDVIKQYYTGLEKQAALDKVSAAMAIRKQHAGLSPTNMLVVSDNPKLTRRRSGKA